MTNPTRTVEAVVGRELSSAPQPFFASVERAVGALKDAGAALPDEMTAKLSWLANRGGSGVVEAHAVLAETTLIEVSIDVHGYGTPRRGRVVPELVEKGWRSFLVRIENPTGLIGRPLLLVNPIAAFSNAPAPGEFSAPMSLSQKPHLLDRLNKAPLVADSWLRAELLDDSPLTGYPVEYRAISLYSSADFDREGRIGITLVPDAVGIHTGRQAAVIPFCIEPSYDVVFDIRDHDGRTCVAGLEVRDGNDQVYPPMVMRVAPDMRFQPQVYRGSGETLRLPVGGYTVRASRGPEYETQSVAFEVSGPGARVEVSLNRWVDPGRSGWFSGDPHLHAAGCSHYDSPTLGVRPETMIRQVRGEALSVGGVLTWGPGYYHQKQFFTGHAISPAAELERTDLQDANNQRFAVTRTDDDDRSSLRYDLEVSGFPSSHLGHVMLLNLQDQDYPGTSLVEDWPSWTLPVLRWAKAQGALVGFAHSGFGMTVESDDLPNLDMPRFDSIGTNEAIVDVTHGAVDFLAGAEAQPSVELNAWYHMLNCGYRLAMLGETDYPCVYDDRPGVGRTYAQLASAPRGDDGWAQWIQALAAGKSYFGDGRTHIPAFRIDGVQQGGTVHRAGRGVVRVEAKIVARLEQHATSRTERIRSSPAYAKPSWHIERARIGDTRRVLAEVVVNGLPAAQVEIDADGTEQELAVDIELTGSSWIAIRVLGSAHSHPLFVEIDDRPIRASRASAQWCRRAVDVLWNEKVRFIRPEEREEAAAAFDVARAAYDRIALECPEEE